MKIASFDLETSSLLADFGIVLCGVVKPWAEPPVVFRIDDFDGEVGSDDSRLVRRLIADLGQYLILVAHNGVQFDRKFLNARAVRAKIEPLDPRGRIIDPVWLARKHLNLRSNSLEAVSMHLQTVHRKQPVDGSVWQRAVLDHDRQALDEIVEHCIQDVLVLEEVCERLQMFVGKIQEWGSA